MSLVNNLRVKSLDSIGQYGALEFRRVFPMSCSNDTLIDVFVETCAQNDFVLTQRTAERASAIKELHNLLGCVLPGLQFFGPLSSRDVVVNLSITVNDKQGYKLLTVVGPKRPAMQAFIRTLERGVSSMGHFWVTTFSDSIRKDFKVSFQQSLDQSPVFHSMAESGNQSYKTEEAAYYYFYKILSNREYSVGADLGRFIAEFPSKVPDLSPSELSREILAQIDQVVAHFDKSYLSLKNPATTLVDDLLPRLRPCVERFVFEALGNALWLRYRTAFAGDDEAYAAKASSIRGSHASALAEGCGVRPQFSFSFAKSISLLNAMQRNFDTSSSIVPNVFLQALLSILISVKTEVLTGTRGQKELESMDDIAPIFFFVLISAECVTTPNAIYHLLLDTMRADQRMETEGRVVALLEGATRLVIDESMSPSTKRADPSVADLL